MRWSTTSRVRSGSFITVEERRKRRFARAIAKEKKNVSLYFPLAVMFGHFLGGRTSAGIRVAPDGKH